MEPIVPQNMEHFRIVPSIFKVFTTAIQRKGQPALNLPSCRTRRVPTSHFKNTTAESLISASGHIPEIIIKAAQLLMHAGNGIEPEDSAALGKVLEATAPGLTSLLLADNDLQVRLPAGQ